MDFSTVPLIVAMVGLGLFIMLGGKPEPLVRLCLTWLIGGALLFMSRRTISDLAGYPPVLTGTFTLVGLETFVVSRNLNFRL